MSTIDMKYATNMYEYGHAEATSCRVQCTVSGELKNFTLKINFLPAFSCGLAREYVWSGILSVIALLVIFINVFLSSVHMLTFLRVV